MTRTRSPLRDHGTPPGWPQRVIATASPRRLILAAGCGVATPAVTDNAAHPADLPGEPSRTEFSSHLNHVQ